MAPLPWRLRALAVPLMLPLLVPAPPRPPDGSMQVTVVDVGQGSAVLVRTREHLLVHDAGPAYSRDSEAGTRVLLPLLRAEATRRIDLLMLSHRDADHVGGAGALLAALPVAALSSSLEASHALRAGSVPHSRCEAGQRWSWDGVDFAVLHPLAADYERPSLKPNALSCVLQVTDAGGHRVLLTGDIEAEQEQRMVRSDPTALRSSVLVVPHHGSKTSSSAEFLDATAPSVAVLQAGYRNRFGHPAPGVVGALRRARHRAAAERPLRRLALAVRSTMPTCRHCDAQRHRPDTGTIDRYLNEPRRAGGFNVARTSAITGGPRSRS